MMEYTSARLLEWSVERLTAAGVGNPRLDAEVLLAEALCCRHHDLYLKPERLLTPVEVRVLQSYVERRVMREPVHYILGRREFWSLDFKITSQVLIPRPETEVLVERFFELLESYPIKNDLRILDIGTGSGIIAITVAKEVPGSRVTAVDISEEALRVARENAGFHGVSSQISFLRGNLFDTIHEGRFGPFDFILSNPPYIDADRLESLMPEVKNYEPRTALDGGVQGLEYYRRIVPEACGLLQNGGCLVLEIGYDQGEAVCGLFHDIGEYDAPDITLDYGGLSRVVSARKKSHG